MDPRRNPYSPGAGTPPPELSGRDELLERAAIALDRIAAHRPARSLILYGLRGVGKTVLLNRFRLAAEERRLTPVRIEAPEDRSLPALLAPSLRASLLRLQRGAARRAAVQQAWRALAGFARALKAKYRDIEVSLDGPAEAGVADSGDLELDLVELMGAVGRAAAEERTAIVFLIDELQYVHQDQLAPLIRALHSATQDELPVALFAAGLPQVLGQMGRAKSYAERLFEFAQVDRLSDDAARAALCVPAAHEGVDLAEGAVAEVLAQTRGYPYFLQEWGKHCWDVAQASPITLADAQAATERAQAELDASFFRVRFDRLTPKERSYLRAMAELGDGPHRSGDIARLLGVKVTSVAKTRSDLIGKGVIYSPTHGDTAFTVPLFAGFMKRIMPQGG
ncbi:MAG: AAA family ATPase [Candidatus Latescibacterota bacterium]